MGKLSHNKHTAADRTDRAKAPIQSKAATGAAFKKGLNGMVQKGVYEIPGTKKATALNTRKGVWHPAASKP